MSRTYRITRSLAHVLQAFCWIGAFVWCFYRIGQLHPADSVILNTFAIGQLAVGLFFAGIAHVLIEGVITLFDIADNTRASSERLETIARELAKRPDPAPTANAPLRLPPLRPGALGKPDLGALRAQADVAKQLEQEEARRFRDSTKSV